MTQSVELLMDPVSEARVVAEWRLLDEAGLRSQAQHRGESNRPHVTLAAVDELPAPLDPILSDVCRRRLPLAATLGALVVFGGRRVTLARLVVPGAALLDLHAAVSSHLDDGGSLTEIGRWVPHVTLALRMPPAELPSAVDVLGAGPGDVRFETARRWDGVGRRTWALV
jgi:2'-5' RNA ligase